VATSISVPLLRLHSVSHPPPVATSISVTLLRLCFISHPPPLSEASLTPYFCALQFFASLHKLRPPPSLSIPLSATSSTDGNVRGPRRLQCLLLPLLQSPLILSLPFSRFPLLSPFSSEETTCNTSATSGLSFVTPGSPLGS
jgi:hypothetical protein